MRSAAGELCVWMRMRRFHAADAKNQQQTDESYPASEGAPLELGERWQAFGVDLFVYRKSNQAPALGLT